MEKVAQDTVVKQSLVEPARKLDPQFHVTADGKVISEQEILEQRHRRAELEKKVTDETARQERWAGKRPIEILAIEIERTKPGTTRDDTFSLRLRGDGAIDVHLHGRMFTILSHVVAYSEQSGTWHVTAKGAVDRLRTAAVRPDVPKAVKQSDIYEEQADILKELAAVAGVIDDEALQENLKQAAESANESIRWKTEVSALFLHLRKRLGEMRCQNSPQPQPPQPQPQAKPQPPRPPRAKKVAKKRQRRKAGAPLADPTPSAPAGHGLEDYQTTSHS